MNTKSTITPRNRQPIDEEDQPIQEPISTTTVPKQPFITNWNDGLNLDEFDSLGHYYSLPNDVVNTALWNFTQDEFTLPQPGLPCLCSVLTLKHNNEIVTESITYHTLFHNGDDWLEEISGDFFPFEENPRPNVVRMITRWAYAEELFQNNPTYNAIKPDDSE